MAEYGVYEKMETRYKRTGGVVVVDSAFKVKGNISILFRVIKMILIHSISWLRTPRRLL